MESHYVLEVDRLSGSPSAIHSSKDNGGSLIQEDGPQTQSDHIVSFGCVENLQTEGLNENESSPNASTLTEGANTFPLGLQECRICQEEDEEGNLETPCACSGTVKFAHRKCVQRWCNEKGDTICEICHQSYKNGYTATPRPDDSGEAWGLTGIHQLDPRDQRIISMAAAQHHMLEAEYNDFSAANASGTACCRSAALILMALLLLRHALSMAASGADEDASTFFTLFLLRAAGFLLPCYIMARALDILQRRRQRQEAALAAAEVALILQTGEARGAHFSVAHGSGRGFFGIRS
ncbi:hypothetical protein O6H91_19G083000 [Diphasiastrum complanatum]|uniref:Uncharacterized protein n=1 Tax=Diphasiastrum complanatum TaxID=34168 RepID=A0ACC2AWZ7_DIPCM|nr:hypothetical protein O6H91_Y346500 [Diphasiastrum complanatum]KAJ7522093.1 hypothetical protein O6H91_19G083000 [Diphasiastrum complanatum]